MQVRLSVTSIDRRERKRVEEAQTLSSGLSEKDSGSLGLEHLLSTRPSTPGLDAQQN